MTAQPEPGNEWGEGRSEQGTAAPLRALNRKKAPLRMDGKAVGWKRSRQAG
ncbi:hypothetical protein ACFPMF_19665 [Larkinella bovis]|uniref:Uncharacterized protein n=1 Tax=Larkinella bovis TaxID=683041 RepID=A0ABW0IFM5_9BACT